MNFLIKYNVKNLSFYMEVGMHVSLDMNFMLVVSQTYVLEWDLPC